MSENAPFTQTVLIPGEPTISNPVPPPMTVRLPIVVLPHDNKNFWVGVLLLLGGVMYLSVAIVIPEFFVQAVSGADRFFVSSWRGSFIFLMLLLLFPFMLFVGMGWIGAAVTCFRDGARGDPVLEITAEGLCDHRSGLSVPWTSIKSAKPLAGFAIDLQLDVPVSNWQNPFRIGVLLRRRRLPDHVIVSVAYLETSAHVLTYTILTLAQSHGGEVISKLPSGLEMYPRLLPRSSPRTTNRPALVL